MKTTIELPDPLFRRAKSKAAERGETLKEFVTAALQDRLATPPGTGGPGWMQGFGKLRRLHKETERIQSRIDAAFEAVEAEDRA